MHKLLTLSVLSASLLVAGCSTVNKVTSVVPESISTWSLVHKPTIQQGNVLTERALEELSPGMSKDEVRFALGTPSLVDTFHQERWDYIYALNVPGKEPVLKTLTIYYVDELVDRIEGDYEADPNTELQDRRVIVSVPDYEGQGFLKRTLSKVGLGDTPD